MRGFARPAALGLTWDGIGKEPFDFLGHFRRVEIADGHDHQVVRGIPTSKEFADLRAIKSDDIRCRSQYRQSVWMFFVASPKGEFA